MAVKICTQETASADPAEEKRRKNREGMRRYRIKEKRQRAEHAAKPARIHHDMPNLVAVLVEGRAGYWRAIHKNGLVQTVQGTHAEAMRKVRVIVDRMNAFEAWCRLRPAKQRITLL